MLCLLAAFAVPVRLKAEYDGGGLGEDLAVDTEDLTVSAKTLLGGGYDLTDFKAEAERQDEDTALVRVHWAYLTKTLEVPCAHSEVTEEALPTATAAPTKTPVPTKAEEKKAAEDINGLPRMNEDDSIDYVKVKENGGVFSILYTDGTKENVEADDGEPDKPELLSLQIQDDQLLFELDDTDEDILYAAFSCEEDGLEEESCGQAYGNGHSVLAVKYREPYIFHSFVVAAIDPEGGVTLSDEMYIQNPEEIAQFDYDYPEAESKKGLQVNSNMSEDVADLGVHNAVVNITMEKLVKLDPNDTDDDCELYYFSGHKYRFNRDYVADLDKQFEDLGYLGIVTNAVLLLQYDSDTTDMIYPGAASGGHRYYALNMKNQDMVQQYAAIFSFLADRYSDEDHLVVNWILGNEVDNYDEWNWCGGVSFEEYMANYLKGYILMYNCTRAQYADAKCMISLDHCWNQKRDGAYTTRAVLDAFVEGLEEYGDYDWWLAYHPYSEPLTDASFWTADSRVTDSLDTECISMKNLDVLTDYVKDTWGDSHKLVLSETGFSSKTEGEEVQAAAIAYAYYLSEANDMVSSLIIHRQSDEAYEMSENLYLGLWNNETGGWNRASSKKYAWEVFKNMDVDLSSTDFALKIIGAKSWDELLKK